MTLIQLTADHTARLARGGRVRATLALENDATLDIILQGYVPAIVLTAEPVDELEETIDKIHGLGNVMPPEIVSVKPREAMSAYAGATMPAPPNKIVRRS